MSNLIFKCSGSYFSLSRLSSALFLTETQNGLNSLPQTNTITKIKEKSSREEAASGPRQHFASCCCVFIELSSTCQVCYPISVLLGSRDTLQTERLAEKHIIPPGAVVSFNKRREKYLTINARQK
jgi:hypothetical protein